MDIELIKTIVLRGVFVEDQHSDTLIYAGSLKASVLNLNLTGSNFSLDEISLEEGKFFLKYYKGDSLLNLQFIIDALSGNEKKDSLESTTLFCKRVIINDSQFSLDDFNYFGMESGFDYNHIAIKEINADISGLSISGDTISGKINELSGVEKCGLELKNLSANAIVCPAFAVLNFLKLSTPFSKADGDLMFNYDHYTDFYDFINKVKITANLVNTELNFSDISYFATPLKGINKKIIFSGNLKGRVNKLKGRDLKIQFGPNSFFAGDVALDGLPNIDETYITLNIKNIETTRKDLELIPLPPFDSANFLNLPPNISLLGKMSFAGNFTGFINDFVALGKAKCSLGEFNSDLKLATDPKSKLIYYEGKISTSGLNIGKVLEMDTLLGIVAGNIMVKGSGLKKENVHLAMSGNISAFDFENYHYQGINIEGDVTGSKFMGQLSVLDKNIHLEFDGNIDFAPLLPVFNFESRIQDANLFALHLLKRDSVSLFSTNAQINFSGNSIDNIKGSALLLNSKYKEGKNNFEMDSLLFTATSTGKEKMLSLESDLVNGMVSGNFLISDLGGSFNHIISRILPSYYNKKTEVPKNLQQFSYRFSVFNTLGLTKIFIPDLILDSIEIAGDYNSNEKRIKLDLNTPNVKYNGRNLKNFNLNINSSDDILTLNSFSKQFNLSDSIWIENVDLVFKLTNDHVQFGYSWKNEKKNNGTNYTGSINGLASIYKNNQFSIKLLSSEIVVADSVWKFGSESEIFIDSTALTFNNFEIRNSKQLLGINGKISENPVDKLNIFLQNFDLKNLNLLTGSKGVKLDGFIQGSATVSNPYKGILFNSNVAFNDFKLNGELLGNGEFLSSYDIKNESISINGSFGRDESKTVYLRGFYYPEGKENSLNLTASVNELNLSLLSPYTVDIASKFSGSASGKINIRGRADAPELSGKIFIKNASFLFDYLNTKYSIDNAEVVIEKNWFGFNNVVGTDINGSQALATGTITHENFKNFNLDITIDARNFQALNTNSLLNSLYYGKAYMTGIVNISGNPDNLVIDITGKSEKGTEFFIPLSGPAEVSEHDFIQFKTKEVSKATRQKDYEVNLSGVQLNFKMEITPEAKIELIFDETVGDIMKARGNGNLMLEINTLGNFNMYGEYVVTEGDYLFTLENIINKKFIVKDGGTITWNGSPYDAIMDLDAMYKLRAPLSDITGDTTMTKRVPVETHMLMTGKIMNPEIKFDIKLPSVGEDIRNNLQTKISTEQDMNKQVFSLLIMNRFYPEQGGVTSGGDLAGTSASELLSNQLSNWLSQTTNLVNLGVNYRSGNEVSTQEVELALSKQLFNDRISIEGNLGVGGAGTGNANTQNSNLVGDVNLEYKISDDGRFRAKMFNETNDYNLANANQSPYTQGIGVFYREEFDTFNQFFKNMFRRGKKKAKNEIENEKE